MEPFTGPWFFRTNMRSFGGGESKLWCGLMFFIASKGIWTFAATCDTGQTLRRKRRIVSTGWVYEWTKAVPQGFFWKIVEKKCDSKGVVCELAAAYYAHAGYPFYELVPHIFIGGFFRFRLQAKSLNVSVVSRFTRFPDHEALARISAYPAIHSRSAPGQVSAHTHNLWTYSTPLDGPLFGLGRDNFTEYAGGSKTFSISHAVCCEPPLTVCK